MEVPCPLPPQIKFSAGPVAALSLMCHAAECYNIKNVMVHNPAWSLYTLSKC